MEIICKKYVLCLTIRTRITKIKTKINFLRANQYILFNYTSMINHILRAFYNTHMRGRGNTQFAWATSLVRIYNYICHTWS